MDKLQESIIEALKLLIKYDIDLIENQPREECINHKLAQYLELILIKEKLLEKHDVDIEYDKYKEDKKKSSDGRNIRPDILVHERKSGNKNNLIVVEAKKNYVSQNDKRKIKDLVQNKKVFSYLLGVAIAYLPNKNYIKISFFLANNSWEFCWLYKEDLKIKKTSR